MDYKTAVVGDNDDAGRIGGARTALLVGLIMVGAVAVVLPLALPPITWLQQLTLVFFRTQDLPLLPLTIMIAALVRARAVRSSSLAAPGWLPWVAAGLLTLLCWWGHYAVLCGFDLSRDEQMANFDATILRGGRLFAPLPAAWRGVNAALNATFILPIGNYDGWVSTYLPGNAMLRAAIGLVADPVLTSPVLAGVGAVMLWRIAMRLWPDAPEARLVALLLYAGASQIVLTAMTSYAMTAHLAANLVWLALFLRGGRAGHGAAIMLGFAATGLHQPLFHPLFVAPFLFMLLRQRRWQPLTGYIAGYALTGLFWLAWPHWLASATGSHLPAGSGFGNDYGTRILIVLAQLDGDSTWLMAANLVRFATWQHLLLLPLLAIGVAVGRADPVQRALAEGILLTAATMALLVPMQGHGWGYRYLHGVEGNACLIAAEGWRWLRLRGRASTSLLMCSSAASLFGILPYHAWMAHRVVTPIVGLDRRIAEIDADMVVIDDADALIAKDAVINRPDLANRPLRLEARELPSRAVAPLCRGRTIAFLPGPALAPYARLYSVPVAHAPSAQLLALAQAARLGGCTVL